MNTTQERLKQIGINISSRRKSLDLSQRDLAKQIGIDYSNLCRIEQGKANPSIETLLKIADGLDVDIVELFIF